MVDIHIKGNVMIISPFPSCLERVCTCHRRVVDLDKFGRRKPFPRIRQEPLYSWLNDTQVVALTGLRDKVLRELIAHNIAYKVTDQSDPLPAFKEDKLTCDFRFGQKEIIRAVSDNYRGIIKAPPAIGKTFVIEQLCLGYEDQRIMVTTNRIDLTKSIKERIKNTCPNLIVTECNGKSGFKEQSNVIICSSGSLHKIPSDWPQLLLFDECHEAGSTVITQKLMNFSDARMFGFSATPKGRSDGSDMVVQALFGKVLVDIDYNEAVDGGSIAPMEVWLVPISGPDLTYENDVSQKRHGIWRNRIRNEKIKQTVRCLTNEHGAKKILILVETAEHAYYIRNLLPEFKVVHGGLDEERRSEFIKRGLITQTENVNPDTDKLRKEFKDSSSPWIIATYKWRQGIDIEDLVYTIRADGASSPITSEQVGGRSGRLHKDKEKGVLIDFTDQFGHKLERKADNRVSNYKTIGWDVVQFVPTVEEDT